MGERAAFVVSKLKELTTPPRRNKPYFTLFDGVEQLVWSAVAPLYEKFFNTFRK